MQIGSGRPCKVWFERAKWLFFLPERGVIDLDRDATRICEKTYNRLLLAPGPAREGFSVRNGYFFGGHAVNRGMIARAPAKKKGRPYSARPFYRRGYPLFLFHLFHCTAL